MASTISSRIDHISLDGARGGIAADPEPGPATLVRRLPGGAGVVELWSGTSRLTLAVSGDVDASDQHAVIDLITDGILRGARRIRVDGRALTFVDVGVLRALLRCQRFLARTGGTLTVSGLDECFDHLWTLLQIESATTDRRAGAPTQQSRPAL